MLNSTSAASYWHSHGSFRTLDIACSSRIVIVDVLYQITGTESDGEGSAGNGCNHGLGFSRPSPAASPRQLNRQGGTELGVGDCQGAVDLAGAAGR